MSALPVAVAPGSLNARAQPSLDAGAGLTLRPFVDADAGALVRAYADPAIQRWHRRSLTRDEALEWIRGRAHARWERETGAEWAVVDSAGVLVGRVGLPVLHLDEGLAEVGYWVLPEGRGRGVAGRALTAMTDWLFALGLHRVELMHSVHNEPRAGSPPRTASTSRACAARRCCIPTAGTTCTCTPASPQPEPLSRGRGRR